MSPYIKKDDRYKDPATPGDVNYALSQIIDKYLGSVGISYTSYNAVVGVLECLKLELYRRFIGVYETHKMIQNGDVFTFNRKHGSNDKENQ